MNCRLCDGDMTGKNGLWLYDYNENVETKLGRKVNIILNSDKNDNLSNYCCEFCSCKIEICFSLIMEFRASDEVIRQTYENLANGNKIDTATQTFICGECRVTITGIKLFTKHYEKHVVKRAVEGSKKDVTVSRIAPYSLQDEKGKEISGVSNFSNDNAVVAVEYEGNKTVEDDVLNGYRVEQVEEVLKDGETDDGNIDKFDVNDEDDDALESMKLSGDYIDSLDENGDDNDFLDSFKLSDEDDDDDDDDDEDMEKIDENDSLLNGKISSDEDSLDSIKLSSDDDFDDDRILEDLNSSTLIQENQTYTTENDENKYKLIGETDDGVQKFDDLDAPSEGSCNSDSSYQNLVDIVTKELEKSDDGEDSLDLAPSAEGIYDCETCKLSFEYKFMLKLHLERNHQDFHDLDVLNIRNVLKDVDNDSELFIKCCYCKEAVPTSQVKEHNLECRSESSIRKNVLCQICGKLYGVRELEKHMQEHKKMDGLACELCGKKFKAKRFLKSHLGEHDESKKKICEICGKKLLPLSFFSHIIKHREKRHVCHFCGKAFTYNYGLRTHLRVHDSKKLDINPEKKKNKVFCWLCKEDFDCTISLNKHLQNDHRAEGVEQDSRFPCSQCEKKFPDMFSLKAHLKLIHEMKDEVIARLKSLPVYRYIECNVCNKVFNSENKIRIHMKQDHGLKPFEMEILKKECEKCGKKFASKQNLIHHINGAHLHIKPMTCDICHEKFAKHSSLIYHKLRHSGEKPFQCEFCQKSYRQRNDVIRHLARHVRDKELTLEEASAVNNSPSRLVIKRRIFLKDSSINYRKVVRKNRRKSDFIKMEPILEEEIDEIQEEQMEFSEDMNYVEEMPVDQNQPESPSDVSYINAKPVYNEERNTIILSSPDVLKNSVKNVTYRYIPSHLKHMPAVVVKKEEQI